MKNHLLIIAVLLSPVLVKAQSTAAASGPATEKSTVTQPSFPDGKDAFNSFIAHTVRYPAIARQNNVQGQVLIEFVVEADGSVTNAKVLSSPSDDMSKECLRVIALSPKWKPGTKDGQPVSLKYKYPINFTLSGGPPNPTGGTGRN